MGGISYGPSVKGVIVCNGYPTAAAHEVGHVFDLYFGEDEQYQSNPLYGDEASGIDITAGDWRWGYDFMGVAFFDTTEYTWVNSEPTYNTLFSALAEDLADPEVVIVSGIFSDSGNTFEMPVDWIKLQNGTISNVPSGDYAIRFIDNNNNTLGTDVSFDVQYFVSIDPGVVFGVAVPNTGVGTIATDEAGFIFAVVVPMVQPKAVLVLDNSDPLAPERVVVEVPWSNIKDPDSDWLSEYGLYLAIAAVGAVVVVGVVYFIRK